jgi:hypothetical protein
MKTLARDGLVSLFAALVLAAAPLGCAASGQQRALDAPAGEPVPSAVEPAVGAGGVAERASDALPPPPREAAPRRADLGDPGDLGDLAELAAPWRHGAPRGARLEAILDDAERRASPAGRRVLQAGRAMIDADEIVLGSCWTFADAVYSAAGFDRRGRRRVWRGRTGGPYVDADALEPGDLLAYINHSYHRGVHSAIFVAWLDRDRREALMMSYVGSRRRVPGDYRSYLLTHVYGVVRPRP